MTKSNTSTQKGGALNPWQLTKKHGRNAKYMKSFATFLIMQIPSWKQTVWFTAFENLIASTGLYILSE